MDECGKTGAAPIHWDWCAHGSWEERNGGTVDTAGYGLKCRYFYGSACTLYPVCQRLKHWWACREPKRYDVARVLLNGMLVVDWERFGVYEVK